MCELATVLAPSLAATASVVSASGPYVSLVVDGGADICSSKYIGVHPGQLYHKLPFVALTNWLTFFLSN